MITRPGFEHAGIPSKRPRIAQMMEHIHHQRSERGVSESQLVGIFHRSIHGYGKDPYGDNPGWFRGCYPCRSRVPLFSRPGGCLDSLPSNCETRCSTCAIPLCFSIADGFSIKSLISAIHLLFQGLHIKCPTSYTSPKKDGKAFIACTETLFKNCPAVRKYLFCGKVIFADIVSSM